MKEIEEIESSELMHPQDVIRALDCSHFTLEALCNWGHIKKHRGFRRIDGKTADFWFLKKQVESLRGLSYSALVGMQGDVSLGSELEKLKKRIEDEKI